MEIIINSNSKTSTQDMIDLRKLLGDIRHRFHFDWHVNTYANLVCDCGHEKSTHIGGFIKGDKKGSCINNWETSDRCRCTGFVKEDKN